ncbi:MAG: RNA polymerase subunit sigma-24 [Deltaproteobacteria bacterium]|nr:RNA polymerase subunit sigma-24 [Deltaproteobacteria bacterium]
MSDPHAAIDAVFRIEFPRLVAALARVTRDVGRAEELAQDALVVALERWPVDGVPDNPGAWLMTTARRRALDGVRHARIADAKHAELAREHDAGPRDVAGELADALDDDIGDDLLRLVFTACHPVLPTEARVALTLRLVGGLATAEIARAFLVPEATIAQRIVRAKRTLADARVPFEVPRAPERAERLASVLEVIYLVFNEGHVATAGASWTRPELCHDALRIARVLAGLAPDEPEVHGLVALLELSASRLTARTARDGTPVLLADQDRASWDRVLVRRGLAALARADELVAARGAPAGPYHLQAAIAAHHARAATAEATEWPRIAALYTLLARRAPSPIVELNRAVAFAMAFGPDAGLELVDALVADGALAAYHLLPAVRGDLLAKLGRGDEARAEFQRAAELTRNERERDVLLARARAAP